MTGWHCLTIRTSRRSPRLAWLTGRDVDVETVRTERFMRTAILSLSIGFCGALLYPERALTCWVDISLEEVVQKNSLVVVGTIERVERATLAADVEEHAGLWHSRPIDVAYIKVDRVLKAQGKHPFAVPGGQIPLGMPSVHRKFIGGADIVYGKDSGAFGCLSCMTGSTGRRTQRTSKRCKWNAR